MSITMTDKTGDPLLAQRVRNLRQKRKLTQQQLADKAEISLATIRKIEIGDRSIGKDTAPKLAAALKTTESYLIYGTEPDSITPEKPKSRIPPSPPDPPLEPELQAILDDPELAIYFSRSSYGSSLSNRQKRQIALNIKMFKEENEERERERQNNK